MDIKQLFQQKSNPAYNKDIWECILKTKRQQKINY